MRILQRKINNIIEKTHEIFYMSIISIAVLPPIYYGENQFVKATRISHNYGSLRFFEKSISIYSTLFLPKFFAR